MTTSEVRTRTADEILGGRFHQEMWDRRLSQREVAAQLGLTQTGLSKKLRGQRQWSIDELLSLASILGLSVPELLEGIDPVVRHQGLEPRTRWLLNLAGQMRWHLRGRLPPSLASTTDRLLSNLTVLSVRR